MLLNRSPTQTVRSRGKLRAHNHGRAIKIPETTKGRVYRHLIGREALRERRGRVLVAALCVSALLTGDRQRRGKRTAKIPPLTKQFSEARLK